MKVWILTKQSLVTAGLIIALLGMLTAAAFVFVPQAVAAVTTARKIPIYRVDRNDKYVSISFDAAWGNEDTQQLIDIMAKYKVHATFFVVAQWVDKYPESVKALHDAGHEVMNHSSTHPHMPKLTRDQMLQEISACDEKIKAVTGVKPFLFRPPYGDYNNALIETLDSAGYYCIQWDVDAIDIIVNTSSALQTGDLRN